jgi:hypothetical protein
VIDRNATNNIVGELHVHLDRSELDCEQPDVDLIAWIEGATLGDDMKEPCVWLTVKRVEEPHGSSDAMFRVSIAKLRALCDMAEAMHKVGDLQWKDSLGENDDGGGQ